MEFQKLVWQYRPLKLLAKERLSRWKRKIPSSRAAGKQILIHIIEQSLKTLSPTIDSYPESRHKKALLCSRKISITSSL